MIFTDKGQIDGRPQTGMVKRHGVWVPLLVVRVQGQTEEALRNLFDTAAVRDGATGTTWQYTALDCVRADDTCQYVWLTYTSQTTDQSETIAAYEEALTKLGALPLETEAGA